ncbi:MAG: response regulator transcription factor [Flavobacteriales bacterium]|nr:response regulator transcription factor [Flavobacteriales bacterium]
MPATQTLPVAVVDDHTLFRGVLADMIDQLGGYKVVVEAGDGSEYVKAVEQGVHVAVAIVDLHMPVMDGYQTIEWIRANAPGTRALALTFERTEEAMVRALRAGACGFLRKDVCKNEFKEALDQVATLGHYHNEVPQEQAHMAAEPITDYERARSKVHEQLTERELEFFRLVCDEAEYTYEQVAERMQVHRRTLDGYRESVFDKFNIKSKAGLVIFGYKWGILKG